MHGIYKRFMATIHIRTYSHCGCSHIAAFALRSIETLKKEISNLDAEFDSCQDVYSKGETDGFLTEKFLVH